MIATCNQTSSSFVFSLFVSIHSPPPDSHSVGDGERGGAGHLRPQAHTAQGSRAAGGQPGRDRPGHGSQHVPAVHRLGLQPRLARRGRLLPLLRRHGHGVQRGQHHEPDHAGHGPLPGERKPPRDGWVQSVQREV